MSDLKTKPTEQRVDDFINGIDDDRQRRDCKMLAQFMRRATGEEGKMWGDAMVGFGHYHYVYDSGREGDWFKTGFSPRKGKLSVYIMAGFDEYHDLMARLGKHKTGKSCLYIKTLDDIDLDVLEELVERSVKHISERYPAS